MLLLIVTQLVPVVDNLKLTLQLTRNSSTAHLITDILSNLVDFLQPYSCFCYLMGSYAKYYLQLLPLPFNGCFTDEPGLVRRERLGTSCTDHYKWDALCHQCQTIVGNWKRWPQPVNHLLLICCWTSKGTIIAVFARSLILEEEICLPRNNHLTTISNTALLRSLLLSFCFFVILVDKSHVMSERVTVIFKLTLHLCASDIWHTCPFTIIVVTVCCFWFLYISLSIFRLHVSGE